MAEESTAVAVVDDGQRRRYVGSADKEETLEMLLVRFESDPDPTNLFSELAMLRALLVHAIQEYSRDKDTLTKRQKATRLESLVRSAERLIDGIGRMVERLEKLRSEGKISESELSFIITQLGRAVEILIPNGIINAGVVDEAHLLTGEGLKASIRDHWLKVLLVR